MRNDIKALRFFVFILLCSLTQVMTAQDILPDLLPINATSDRSACDIRRPRLPGSIYSHRSYASMLHGIDVSHHNGLIDWSTVSKQNDAAFVYIKATEGHDFIDSQYTTNIRQARKNNIKVGSYHFFRANIPADQQFKLFKRTISLKEQDLLPMIDVEVTNGVGVFALQARLIEFARLVENYIGCPPLIYTGRNFYNQHFAGYTQFRKFPFWIAQYSEDEPALDYGDDYLIWQYTSKARVSGIHGNVDKNCFMNGHSLREIIYKR